MANVEKLSIALTPDMAAELRAAVEAGDYGSVSEVVRDALRDWTHKRQLREQGLAGLRRKWLDAVADDSEGLDADAIFDRLEGKHEKLAEPSGK